MKTIIYIFLIGLICYSCNNSSQQNRNSTSNNYDETFIIQAVQGNLAEVEAGKLAASRAQHADVKMFGSMMVKDHQGAFEDLKKIAGEMHITIPDKPDAMHRNKQQQLSALSGEQFDSAYMHTQVMDHETTVALFEKEVNAATNEKLKAYAINYLPALRMHLEKARSISEQIKQTRVNNNN